MKNYLLALGLFFFSFQVFAQKSHLLPDDDNKTSSAAAPEKESDFQRLWAKNFKKKFRKEKSEKNTFDSSETKINTDELAYYDSLYIDKLKKTIFKAYIKYASLLTRTKIEYREHTDLSDLEREGTETDTTELIQPDDSLFFAQTDSLLLLPEDADLDLHHLPYTHDAVVQMRLKAMQNVIPLTYNEEVRLYIDFYSIKLHKRMTEIMKRSAAYFPLFEKTLADYNMPDELKYLAVIESALLPTVRSRAGALGLWQFMPVSGRKFGLPMNYYFDERINPVRSTRAACELLALLYDMFGDWELALAAYNCGPGTVKKAQRRSGKTGFWEIYDYLPSETRGYVPSFTAAMYSFEFKDELNMVTSEKHNYIPSEKVSVNKSIDLRLLATELGMCFEDLKALNPQLLRNIIPNSSKPYDLNVPKNRVQFFQNNYDKILLAAAATGKSYVNVTDFASRKYGKKGSNVVRDGNLHTVSKGETLGHIAIMYGTSVRKLMENNNLYNHKLQIGQRLFVGGNPDNDGNLSASAAKNHALKKEKNTAKNYLPVNNSARNDKKAAEKKGIITASGSAKGGKIHTVVNGDSLWKIAKKYKTSIDALKKANSLKNDRLDLGQKIVVPR